MRIEGSQIRAARALLDWSRSDLAAAADLSEDAILRMEKGAVTPSTTSLNSIENAFDKAGVVFTENGGIKRRDDSYTEILGADAWLKIQDDIFYTLKGQGGEVLFYWVDDSVSSPEAVINDIKMRASGIRFRTLIAEGNTYCLYPLREYRCLPKEHFHNHPKVIYADKVALLMDGGNRAIILREPSWANAERMQFNLLWTLLKMPQKSTALQTYE